MYSGPITFLNSGVYANCARSADQRLKCWGYNWVGTLGLGDTVDRGGDPGHMGSNLPVVNLGTGKYAMQVSIGQYHACAVLNDGSVKCWGYNANGRLGLEDTTTRGDQPNEMGDNLPTVNVGTGKTVVQVAAAARHTCALLNDGTVKCWGDNSGGELGLGDTQIRGDGPGEMGDNLPTVNLGTGKTAVMLASGYHSTCAVLNDGTLKCWGTNEQGVLGLGDTNSRGDNAGEMGDNLPAVALGTGKTVTSVALNYARACVILNDASVKCWGYAGSLGLGDNIRRGDKPGDMGDNLPVVNLGTGKTATAIGLGSLHTCAILNDATMKCWGFSGYGQCGLGDANTRGDEPNEMGDLLPAVNLGTGKTALALSIGERASCAVVTGNVVKCWGYNGDGQLGLGDLIGRGSLPNQMGDNLPAVNLF